MKSKKLILETQRLLLKPIRLEDFEHLLKLRTDPIVMRYIGDGQIQTKEQVQEFIMLEIEYHKQYGFGFCSVFEKLSGEFVGQAGLFHLGYNDTQPEIEVAYRLLPAYWGKGYATELTKALIHWGFTHLPNSKLIAAAHPDNLASQQVLKKSGFVLIGTIRWHNNKEVKGFEIYKDDAIELTAYDSKWPELAKIEIQKLHETLSTKNILDIQHVGSTAIPGLMAKPIIDIQIAVDSLAVIKEIAIHQLKKLNYVFWDENPDPTRLFFVKGMPPFGKKREYHVHIVESSSKHWIDKIKFRDYLIAHPQIARDYEQLKVQLSKQYSYDREGYTQSKTQFIRQVLQKTDESNIAN